jgi:hypothetical protein
VKESDVGDAEMVPPFTVSVTGTLTGAAFGADTVTDPLYVLAPRLAPLALTVKVAGVVPAVGVTESQDVAPLVPFATAV